jgi:hypothetical protein
VVISPSTAKGAYFKLRKDWSGELRLVPDLHPTPGFGISKSGISGLGRN